MNEDFLHYIWKYHQYDIQSLQTTQKEELVVLKAGLHNTNSGPDFLNAQLKINGQLWVGNVEIHLKSSDWYAHHHEIDDNYDAVILHVVWEDDAIVYMKNNNPLTTLILKDFVSISAFKNYKNLFFDTQRWIPCEHKINTIDSFTLEHWKERLFFNRLERKSEEMQVLLKENNNDFESVLFQLIAKNFGLKVNGDSFLDLAKSIDFSIIRKVRTTEYELDALLYGQAGFLENDIEENYYKILKREYEYIQHKYQLKPPFKNLFSFFRMRPHNFPTIRIAQLSALYQLHQNLFSKIVAINRVNEFYKLFSIEVPSFWKTHYTFEKVSKPSTKKLTKPFVDLIIINTILPLKFLYKKNRGEVIESDFLDLLKEIKPEKNNIITKFNAIGIATKNSYDTQTLLELKNTYCAKKLCLQCAIGKSILGR